MAIAVKICGLNDRQSVEVAIDAGASYAGFVFYPPSPRSVTAARAAELMAVLPSTVQSVGVMVDPDDGLLDQVLEMAPLDIIQLHGRESPERIAEIRTLTGRRVIKAIKVAGAEDLEPVRIYAACADMLLFDAKPPSMAGTLPGGNGRAFDWRLLQDIDPGTPWVLSGGLQVDNLAAAYALCQPAIVDVSSGVETAPGTKDPAKIRAFLNLAASLSPGGGH